MEQPATSEVAQHGDQIEITEPGRVDFGKRFQVESTGPLKVMVLDNRIRVFVLHSDYKVVKRCGKPATEAPKKVGRPSNAELAARAVEASKEATKDVPVVTKEEIAALEQAIDVPVTRKTIDERAERVAHFKRTRKQPEVQPAPHAQVGDIIKITHGDHLIDPNSKYVAGTELRVHASAEEVIARGLNNYAPLVWNFIVKHSDYEIVSTAGQEKALQDVRVEIAPAQERIDAASENLQPLYGVAEPQPVKLTQEQFDAMTRQDPIPLEDHLKRMTTEHGVARMHSHYFKACPFDHVDVYRVLSLFNVVDPCLQHAVKKLLVAGGRGHKDIQKDVQDSIDTLERWKAMRDEEKAAS